MIIYNVTVQIDKDICTEWVAWMKEVHIPEVMLTGCFTEYRFCRVMVDDESGVTYSIQYTCDHLGNYEVYRDQYAAELQKKHRLKYEGKFVAFRTLLEGV